MPNPLYDELFARHAGSDAPFAFRDGGTLGYGAFLDRAARFANALARMGLGPGDRLAVQAPKSLDMLAIYAACIRSGIVFLPLNTGYTPAEIAFFLQDSGARLLICAPDRAEALLGALGGAMLETLDATGGGSMAAAADAAPAIFDTVTREPGDLAALLYTSGTTGRAKGAMLTQDNLLSNALALADLWRFTASDRLVHALPIFHTHGLFVAVNVTLAAGGAMIFLPGFDADRIVAELPRATVLMGVPTFYSRLLAHPGLTSDRTRDMRLFISGSAPLSAATHRAFEARTGHRILERYGMTETNMTSSNPYDGARRAGTVGFPLPGVELRIADAEGRALPEGEIGGIEVRGPNVFAGYWNLPDKTAQEMRADGFFVTGDLGRIDEEGYLQIVGRSKDLVISGGYNIYPKEIEEVLDAQPGIAESAVIGVPHLDLGEVPVAVIVARDDPAPAPETILARAAEKLARYKLPRRVIALDALPRNAMGKVQKAELRDRFRDIVG
ncbi:malonyl-CoA synthase [Palleronia sediminis]|uniref:Malonyl-CoA synthase n=1 Tax=Palleronia sediminis TaxID=2547833 RepID=A0A4V6PP82_9RHOB|nr:AMP-binding protein [Palleronia sediminis]TDL81239.1 malonyl-CoA synthase [Palleronia sediminis]